MKHVWNTTPFGWPFDWLETLVLLAAAAVAVLLILDLIGVMP